MVALLGLLGSSPAGPQGGSPRREPSNPQASALDCMMTRPNTLGLYHHYHLTTYLMLPALLTHVTRMVARHRPTPTQLYAYCFVPGNRLTA